MKYYFYLKEAIGKETQFHNDAPKMVDEFLVIFPVLIKIAREYGLNLVMKKNFRQYFDDMTSENPASGDQNLPNERDRGFNKNLFYKMVEQKIQADQFLG